MREVQDMEGFNAVLPVCRRVIAAVASPHQAAEMEAGGSQTHGGLTPAAHYRARRLSHPVIQG